MPLTMRAFAEEGRARKEMIVAAYDIGKHFGPVFRVEELCERVRAGGVGIPIGIDELQLSREVRIQGRFTRLQGEELVI
jgi:hypothetical protein